MTAGSDTFADAPLLEPVQNLTVHAVGPSAGSSTEAGEPLGETTPDPIDRTRWLKFVPAVDGRLGHVALTGTTGPWRRVALFSGDGTLAGLTPLGTFWSPDTRSSLFTATLTAGQTYWLQVGTEVGAADSDYELVLTFEQRVRIETDWTQGADFTREVGALGVSQYASGYASNVYGNAANEGVAGGFSAGLLADVQTEALARDTMTHVGLGIDDYASLMHVAYGYFEDADASNYYAWSQAYARHFSAWDKRQPPTTAVPSGYVGVEWELPLCDVVGGTLLGEVVNGSKDISTTPSSPVMDGRWFSKLTADNGSAEWSTPASTSTPDSIVHHDLASPAGTTLAVFGAGRDVSPAPESISIDVSDLIDTYGRLTLVLHLDSSDFEAPTPAALTPNSTEFAFGASLSAPYVEMLMRPPRHRFYGYQWAAYTGEAPRLRKYPTAPLRKWPPENFAGTSLRKIGSYP